MKKTLPIFLAAVLLAGCAAPAEGIAYRQISMDEAITMMEEESGYLILDVRTPEEFADKHIPGAVNVPNETIGSAEIPALGKGGRNGFFLCHKIPPVGIIDYP